MHLLNPESVRKYQGVLHQINGSPDPYLVHLLREEIKRLPWWDEPNLVIHFEGLSDVCYRNNVDFWKLVQEVGGFFAMRMLIHAILVAKGIPTHAPSDVGEAADKGSGLRHTA